jgi:dipeptidyl aminopeptidase/acylaminoacyl peptidase
MKTKFAILTLSLMCSSRFFATAQENFIAPTDNFVVDGIPNLPAQLADQVSRYTEFRVAGFSSWHPIKREMLIVTRFGDTLQAHLVNMPGGARKQLTFFKDSVSGVSHEPTKGNYFVFAKDSGGNENYQKYRYDFATGDITMFTDGKSRNTGGIWSNKGDQYVYSSNSRNGRDMDLWVVNPTDPKSNRLLAELQGGGWSALDFSFDDKQLLVSEYISANESYLWIFNLTNGDRRLITQKGGAKVAYGNAKFDKDGEGVYTTSDWDSEFKRLAYIDIQPTRTLQVFLTSHIKWDVGGFELSWDGKAIAFYVNEGGFGVMHLLDIKSGKSRPMANLPRGWVAPAQWHKNNRDLGFAYISARSPQDCYSLDVKTGKVERWTASETGGLSVQTFSEPELVGWKSFDDRMISGFLYKPPAKFNGKRPVIVDIHGGPEGQSTAQFIGDNNYFINELGVAVIRPNIRGSTGYGKTFLALDNGLLREGSYKDIAALFDWIKARPDLDGDRIMVTGGSYGGHMTLVVATYYPDKIRCALDVVGMSHLGTFLKNTSGYRQDLRRVEYGDERDPAMQEFFDRTAPLNNAAKITKPLFVVQGGNDPRVPLSESEQIIKTVKGNGTPLWYLMAKDEGHGFAKKKNREFLLYSKVLFVQEYLLK